MTARRGFVVAGLGVATFLVVLVSPHASSSPDGLERVADDQGLLDSATGGQSGLAYGPVTGVIGLAIAFALVAGVLALARSRRSRT